MIIFVPSKFEPRTIISETLNCRFVQKVIDPLFVDLKVAAVDSELFFLEIRLLLNQVKKVMDGSGYQAIIILRVTWRGLRIVIEFRKYGHRFPFVILSILVTFHCKSFSWPSLSIGEDCCVITLFL